MQRRAPISFASSAMNWPCSGLICISASGRGAVASLSRASTGTSRTDTFKMY
jgi:hypothetical protein